MIVIDGSQGEGGGQILRSSLALSLVTGKPFRIERIRARRQKPGLLRQHLTAVMAAARVGAAAIEGAELGSQQLTFVPGGLHGGVYSFQIGTAGSTTLVLQTILVPLFFAETASTIEIEGGTHNSNSPPFDFLTRSYLPLLRRMGARAEVELVRPGFYPAGGGKILVTVEPSRLGRLELLERGALIATRARACVANLPYDIAQREVAVVGDKLGWTELQARTLTDSVGPGNVLTLEAEYEHVTEVVTGFGERGVRAEEVASRASEEMLRYLSAEGAAGEHLADQLLLPMALGGGGEFTAVTVSSHTTTNAEVIGRFLDVRVGIEGGR
ncbi:MAG TPA: RNA 3'-terminal phosphate cyclase, partial [Thermoanaerobaculia bacterium]